MDPPHHKPDTAVLIIVCSVFAAAVFALAAFGWLVGVLMALTFVCTLVYGVYRGF